jgi:triphosphatase
MSQAEAASSSESEIELKLLCAARDAKSVWTQPAVKALLKKPPRTRRVRTVYHDTPEADLMRAGCALRVREIDGKFEQHLKTAGKVEGGLFRRQEWHAPLASETPMPLAWDGDARALIEPHADTLRKMFETDMERTDAVLTNGVFAVEVAVDIGTIRAFDASGAVMRETQLTEVELEWKAGPASHVFDLALDLAEHIPMHIGWQSKAERGYALALALAPAARRAAQPQIPGAATTQEAIAAILGEGMNHFLANQPYLEAQGAIEAVHQMRVACRRLRAALSLFRPFLPADETTRFRDGFRDLASALGAVRDIDVLSQTLLDPLLDEPLTPDAVRDALDVLRPQLARRRAKNLDDATALVRSPKTARLLLSLGRRITLLVQERSAAGSLAGDFADTVLAKRQRKLKRNGRKLRKQSAAERHQVRIAAKKVRYAAEFFRSRYAERPMRRYLDALGDLQDALGDLNDIAAAPRVLEAVAEDRAIADLVGGYAMGWHTRRLRFCLDEAEDLMHALGKADPFTKRRKR